MRRRRRQRGDAIAREAAPVTPQPVTTAAPTAAQREDSPNLLALGAHLVRHPMDSLAKAAREATTYAPATIWNAAGNGITRERAIAVAVRAEPAIRPSKL